jgi:hypothetical protein
MSYHIYRGILSLVGNSDKEYITIDGYKSEIDIGNVHIRDSILVDSKATSTIYGTISLYNDLIIENTGSFNVNNAIAYILSPEGIIDLNIDNKDSKVKVYRGEYNDIMVRRYISLQGGTDITGDNGMYNQRFVINRTSGNTVTKYSTLNDRVYMFTIDISSETPGTAKCILSFVNTGGTVSQIGTSTLLVSHGITPDITVITNLDIIEFISSTEGNITFTFDITMADMSLYRDRRDTCTL